MCNDAWAKLDDQHTEDSRSEYDDLANRKMVDELRDLAKQDRSIPAPGAQRDNLFADVR